MNETSFLTNFFIRIDKNKLKKLNTNKYKKICK